jgi:hypothetical protein
LIETSKREPFLFKRVIKLAIWATKNLLQLQRMIDYKAPIIVNFKGKKKLARVQINIAVTTSWQAAATLHCSNQYLPLSIVQPVSYRRRNRQIMQKYNERCSNQTHHGATSKKGVWVNMTKLMNCHCPTCMHIVLVQQTPMSLNVLADNKQSRFTFINYFYLALPNTTSHCYSLNVLTNRMLQSQTVGQRLNVINLQYDMTSQQGGISKNVVIP